MQRAVRQGPGTGTDAAAKEGRRAAGSGPGYRRVASMHDPDEGS